MKSKFFFFLVFFSQPKFDILLFSIYYKIHPLSKKKKYIYIYIYVLEGTVEV